MAFDLFRLWKGTACRALLFQYVALLYRGSARKNWAKADEIALETARGELVSDYSNLGKSRE